MDYMKGLYTKMISKVENYQDEAEVRAPNHRAAVVLAEGTWTKHPASHSDFLGHREWERPWIRKQTVTRNTASGADVLGIPLKFSL